MRWVLLALPLLLGNQPPPSCPALRPGERLVEATVEAVEHPTYSCAVGPGASSSPQRCIWAFPVSPCDVVLSLPDGTTRTAHMPDANALWCDLPMGQYVVSLCTPSGTLECPVLLGDQELGVDFASSLPGDVRVHLRVEGREVIRDSDIPFEVGQRWPYVIRHGAKALLDGCDVSKPPARDIDQDFLRYLPTHEPERGCGHCNAGDGGAGYFVYAALVLLVIGRRRRPSP